MVCQPGNASPERSIKRVSLKGVLIAVTIVTVLINVSAVLSSPLWVYPDSVDYVRLAGGIVDRLDFGNELFLVRTPGYPLILAGIFALFGPYSPTAIQVVQHAMVVGTVLLTLLIAWHLTGRRYIALLAGLFCACSLQIISYANMVLAETPYTLTLTACVYFLVRYYQSGAWRFLAMASLTAGAAYLLRPIGLFLIGVCVAAAFFRVWKEHRAERNVTNSRRVLRHSSQMSNVNRPRPKVRPLALPYRLAVGLATAAVPALTLAAPWMVNNVRTHRTLQASRCLDYVLYGGLVKWHGLDSTKSAAMAEIRQVVDEAIRKGHLPTDADYRDRAIVMQAYEAMRDASFATSSAVMGRAGRDLLWEHPWSAAVGTIKHTAWMLLSPDPVYRFQPDGAVGINGKRNASAAILDIGTYSFGPGSWEHVLRRYRHYLPLNTEPRCLSPVWTALVRMFHEHVGRGAPIAGLRDTVFEELMLVCVLGGGLTLFTRRRSEWLLVAAIVGFQIVISGFLGGPQGRYVAPVKPFMLVYAAFLLGAMAHVVVQLASRRMRPARGFDRGRHKDDSDAKPRALVRPRQNTVGTEPAKELLIDAGKSR